MIPKRIFYVWGANEPKKRDVLACMQSWFQNCPDYEVIEINENSKDFFDFQAELATNRWFNTIYQRKMWAYVADYIRIKVLYKNGGIYLDTDVSVLRSFDSFLHDSAFVGMQNTAADGIKDIVEPAILGAEKGNKFLKAVLDIYNDEIWKRQIYSMPDLFDYTFQTLYPKKLKRFPKRSEQKRITYPDIVIYPEKVFIPFRSNEVFNRKCLTPQTHTIHWYGNSWINPETLFFLRNKHRYSLKKIDSLQQKHCQVRFLNIPLLKLSIFKNRISWGKISFLKKDTTVISDKQYDQLYCWKMFGFIPVFKCRKRKSSSILKYYIFNILILKIT